MNASAGSLSEMVNSSIDVLTKPSVPTFERYERRGNLQKALFYVGVAAIVSALIAFLGGLIGGALDETRGALSTGVIAALRELVLIFVSFLVFTGTVFYVGHTQGGTGSLDEVAYSFALFYVPISVLSSVLGMVLLATLVLACLAPLVWLAAVVAYAFFAWLAVQSSMNLRNSTKTLITLGAAVLVTLVVRILINAIL